MLSAPGNSESWWRCSGAPPALPCRALLPGTHLFLLLSFTGIAVKNILRTLQGKLLRPLIGEAKNHTSILMLVLGYCVILAACFWHSQRSVSPSATPRAPGGRALERGEKNHRKSHRRSRRSSFPAGEEAAFALHTLLRCGEETREKEEGRG